MKLTKERLTRALKRAKDISNYLLKQETKNRDLKLVLIQASALSIELEKLLYKLRQELVNENKAG